MQHAGQAGAMTDLASRPPTADQLQSELFSNGFVVLPNVLTREEIASLRATVQKHLRSAGRCNYGGKFQLYALYEAENVARLMTSDKVLSHLKKLTQPLDVVLTGECDLMINTTSSWHTDVPHHPASSDGSLFSDESFRVYKIAFYLQDQPEDARTTLKVRPGSHLKGRYRSFPEKGLAVKAGDAIIFDVRIEHAGQMPTLVDKALRRLVNWCVPLLRRDPQELFTWARTVIRKLTGMPDRVAVFMTFGPAEPWTYSYAEVGRARHPGVRGALSADALDQLVRNNVGPPLIGQPAAAH